MDSRKAISGHLSPLLALEAEKSTSVPRNSTVRGNFTLYKLKIRKELYGPTETFGHFPPSNRGPPSLLVFNREERRLQKEYGGFLAGVQSLTEEANAASFVFPAIGVQHDREVQCSASDLKSGSGDRSWGSSVYCRQRRLRPLLRCAGVEAALLAAILEAAPMDKHKMAAPSGSGFSYTGEQ
ncbi:hypothetical protein NDU88_000543 [Pleurodeles waltl]|uniref:Uncharacterized protein n=1 Tax=Pleurodeles waltl TaxID=8319 RepID=A0AAV7LWL8_PLEWA|nr:hypothetical protein NDU88_000543 [Pleurodeles waltl]